jgi:hypothetical protein
VKIQIVNPLSHERDLHLVSRKNRVGVVVLLAVFLCGFAASASAQWTQVTSPTAMSGIQVGTTQMWTRDSSGNVYQYNKKTNSLTKITAPTSFAQIAVGKGNNVWTLDSSQNVYSYNFSTKKFVQVTGQLFQIAAGGQGVWGVSKSGHIYMWNGTSFAQPPNEDESIDFTTVFVGSYEIGVWAFDSSNNTYLFNSDTGFFDQVGPGTKTQVAVGTAEVWSINSSSQIYMYDIAAEQWVQVDPSEALGEIAAGTNANIWGLSSGQVYRYSTKKPKQFDLVEPQPPESSAVLRVSSAGTGVFVLSTSGQVYKY